MYCYFKNYRNHSQALKVVLYDNVNENSKSYLVPKPVYLQKHETKQFEFQIPVAYNSGVEKIKYQILNYIYCMKMMRNTINL